jgi:chromosome segregation ATPase
MLLAETAIFYLLLGGAVAIAVFIRGRTTPGHTIGLRMAAACLFWPLFLPVLLAEPGGDAANDDTKTQLSRADQDALAAAISQVETELDAALEGLDGWAENVLNSEHHRLEELRLAWKTQADRIRQIDRLLADPSATADSLTRLASDVESARQSEKTRQENIRQLSLLRNRMHADLVGTLAWVRELVTMIHLAKFSGAPAARAEELVAQIAAAVQGLSEVSSWREQEQAAAPDQLVHSA